MRGAPLSAGFYCYPWNVHDPHALLAEFAAAGLTHLTVATSYHAGKFLQPRDPEARVYFPEDGTVYFRARCERYGRLEPKIATITAREDVLAALCDAAAMPVRAWTVLNHNSRLGWENPDIVARNAWGDPYYYSLCPASADVQDYAVALCADLAGQYPLQSLLLETPGWLTYDHGYHHEVAQFPVTPALERLLELCFCDSCMALARDGGVDTDALRQAVRIAGDALIAGDPAAALPDLAAYDGWRCSVVTDLCKRIRAAVRPEVGVRVISTCQRPHATCYREGGDLAGFDRVTDGLELPIYQPSAGAAEADLLDVLGQIGDPARLGVILRPGHPDMTSAAQLRDTLARVTGAGVRDLSFYNYGLLPATQIQWVRDAIGQLREALADV